MSKTRVNELLMGFYECIEDGDRPSDILIASLEFIVCTMCSSHEIPTSAVECPSVIAARASETVFNEVKRQIIASAKRTSPDMAWPLGTVGRGGVSN